MRNEDANPQTQQSDQNITQGQMMPQGQMMAYPPGVMPMMGPGMMPMGPGMMPMGPGMMPGMGYGPGAFIYIEDPILELANCTGAIIRQEVEMFEIVSGCETQNRYHVFLRTPYGLKYAFKCNEQSCGCARCCLSANSRPVKIIMRHVISFQQYDGDMAKVFINVDKPCKCACCCFCRPYMDVRLADNGQQLGIISEPCTCCDVDMEVLDTAGNLRYDINGDCCQLGLCCGPSLKKLANVNFEITENGYTVGAIRKLTSSLGEFFTKADSYEVVFPEKATPSEKLLLILATLMIDYQNFESDNSDPYDTYY